MIRLRRGVILVWITVKLAPAQMAVISAKTKLFSTRRQIAVKPVQRASIWKGISVKSAHRTAKSALVGLPVTSAILQLASMKRQIPVCHALLVSSWIKSRIRVLLARKTVPNAPKMYA